MQVWVISCLGQYLTDAQSSFHLCHSDQLTVPPVKVINASISQLYDDQVRLTSSYFSLFCSGKVETRFKAVLLFSWLERQNFSLTISTQKKKWKEGRSGRYCLDIWKLNALLFRVYAVADGSDSEAPVLVVVRHEKGVLSWQVGSYV